MLTDREQEIWREIQRRLVEDPDLPSTFQPVDRRGPGDHHRSAQLGAVVVSLTLVMLLLIGPNLLTEAEVADRRQPPRPHESPALGAGDHASGVEWVPTGESGPAGSFMASDVSASQHDSTPSAAA